MKFQPSQASYGVFNPAAITAVADLVGATAGAGVAIGGAVAQRKARKKEEAAAVRRRRKKKANKAAALAQPDLPPMGPTPPSKWVLPLVGLAVAGIIGGVWYSTSKKGK